MSAPSSPSPSSGSDDFAALLDADLENSLEELGELSRQDGEEDVDVEDRGETDEVQELGSDVELGEDSLAEEEEEDGDEEQDGGEDEQSKDFGSAVRIGKDTFAREQFDGEGNSGLGKRKREEEAEAQADAKSAKGVCPPHPGFMWGVCIRCGENRQHSNSEPEPAAVSLRYIHEGLEVSEIEAARMRQDELKHVMVKQKLYLVLDLDHTLLNSARFIEVNREEEDYLAACYWSGSSAISDAGSRPGEGEPSFQNGLHRLNKLQMWTKIRPFAHDFIEAASKICEMYVYTMGERAYAVAMVRLLDPTGRFFGDRIISQGDSTHSTMKDLDVVLGAESAVVILDDTEGVWPKHRANLILMERYHFFRSSCRQFRLETPSLTERRRDESEKEGTLATALKTIRALHHTVFSTSTPLQRGSLKLTADYQDVRKVIQSMKLKILKGCRVVFSRIFPSGMPNPEAHPFWQLTAELGAHCSTTSTSGTTHVIALDRGTDKAKWAKQHEKFLVHPSWVHAAQYLWCRPREQDFPVRENNPPTSISSFSRTVDVTQQTRSVIGLNGTIMDGVENRDIDVANEVKDSPKNAKTGDLDSLTAPKKLGRLAEAIIHHE